MLFGFVFVNIFNNPLLKNTPRMGLKCNYIHRHAPFKKNGNFQKYVVLLLLKVSGLARDRFKKELFIINAADISWFLGPRYLSSKNT